MARVTRVRYSCLSFAPRPCVVPTRQQLPSYARVAVRSFINNWSTWRPGVNEQCRTAQEIIRRGRHAVDLATRQLESVQAEVLRHSEAPVAWLEAELELRTKVVNIATESSRYTQIIAKLFFVATILKDNPFRHLDGYSNQLFRQARDIESTVKQGDKLNDAILKFSAISWRANVDDNAAATEFGPLIDSRLEAQVALNLALDYARNSQSPVFDKLQRLKSLQAFRDTIKPLRDVMLLRMEQYAMEHRRSDPRRWLYDTFKLNVTHTILVLASASQSVTDAFQRVPRQTTSITANRDTGIRLRSYKLRRELTVSFQSFLNAASDASVAASNRIGRMSDREVRDRLPEAKKAVQAIEERETERLAGLQRFRQEFKIERRALLHALQRKQHKRP